MPHVHGWHSRDREPPAADHDRLGLLVIHLLFHVEEYLKEPILVLRRGCLDVGGYPLGQGGARVFGSMWLLDGGGTVPPMA